MLLGSIMDEYDNRNDFLLEETTSPSEMDDPLQNTLIAATSMQGSSESRSLGHRNSAGMTQSVRRQPSAASDAAAALSKTTSNSTPTFETTQH
jgi:hypothetical protein